MIILTYSFLAQLATWFAALFFKPGLKLLNELPVFFLQLYRGKILLICALLVVKCEEKCVEVKFLEVFPSIEERYCGEVVFFPNGHWVSWIHRFLVMRFWNVPKWCLQEFSYVRLASTPLLTRSVRYSNEIVNLFRRRSIQILVNRFQWINILFHDCRRLT